MLRYLAFCLLCAGLLATSAHAADGDPAARGLAIATAADAANTGFVGESSTLEMVLINAQNDRVTRKMQSKISEREGGDRSIITFEWPPDVKGTRMLTWTHANDNDDQWLYLAKMNRVKRISSRGRTGSFMGSEFAYEDLGSQEIEKYTYKWLRDELLDGRKTQVIERIPVGKSGYSKQHVWIDVEYQSAVKIDFYDRKGELLKTMTLSAWKQFETFWRANKIEVTNHQTKKRSELVWSDRALGKSFADADFDPESLSDD